MFKMSTTCRAIALVMGGLAAATAQAQTEESKKNQRIEITGSNVKRSDTETVSPVTIITRDQIERSGRVTIAEVLRELPLNSSGSFN